MQLSTDQEAAVDYFLDFLTLPNCPEMILNGPAGFGKTFLTKHLVAYAKQHMQVLKTLTGAGGDLNVEYTSTTNKAAGVLAEALGEPTKTIYSLIGLRVTDNYKTGKTYLAKTRQYMPQKNTLLIIDEAGALDKAAIEAVRESATNCKILYVLDESQTTPIFDSVCPIINMVDKVFTLTTPHRNQGAILDLAHQFRETIRTGIFKPIVPVAGVIEKLGGVDYRDRIAREFKVDPDNINHAKIMAWTNKIVIGTNNYVRGLFTASETYDIGENLIASSPLISDNGKIIASTEQPIKVTGKQENHDHRALKIRGTTYQFGKGSFFVPDADAGFELLEELRLDAIENKYWGHFMQSKKLMGDVRPPYASTVHKSQGSTYKYAFINLSDIGRNNKPMEVARLLYVAISRASHGVIFNGSLPAKYGG